MKINHYQVAVPISPHLVVGDSLLTEFERIKKLLIDGGVEPTALGVYSQMPLDGYANNVVAWNIRCTEETLTMLLLKTQALLL